MIMTLRKLEEANELLKTMYDDVEFVKEYKLVYDISDETFEIDFDAKSNDDARKFADEYFYENLSDEENKNLSSVDIFDITDNVYKAI